jgi:integrase
MTPVSFAQFSAEVLTLYDPPVRRKSTRAKVRQVLAELGAQCVSTADLTPAAVSRWLSAHPERRAATHRGLLSTLRAACGYGAFQDYLVSPFAFRRLAQWLPADELVELEPFRRHRSAAEVAALLDQADAEASSWKGRRMRALVYCYAFTGAGKTEVLGLRVADVDLAAGIISVRSHPIRRLKTGARAARLPIAAPLAAVLESWMPETGSEWLFPHCELSGPWFHGRPGYRPLDQVKALGRRAGVDDLTILSLRHTIGTLAEGWGIGELMLQRLLRHSRAATQKHYRHEDLDQLRRAAGQITYRTEPP